MVFCFDWCHSVGCFFAHCQCNPILRIITNNDYNNGYNNNKYDKYDYNNNGNLNVNKNDNDCNNCNVNGKE